MEISSTSPPMDPVLEKETLGGVVGPQKAEIPGSAAPVDPVRSVNFILDPSAFTLGLGNIERWFDREYFRAQVKDKLENIDLNLYVPTYTLNELDYQRRGPIVGSTRAQEALKFIDRMSESDDGMGDFEDSFAEPDPETRGPAAEGRFRHNLFLEHRTQSFPQWGACARFQVRSPGSQELPSHGRYSLYDEINHLVGEVEDGLEGREVPSRLKHLIRSAVYLTKMNHNGPQHVSGSMWKLVTEDATTRVWASCFGVDCLNINEAELLLFQGKDLTLFEIRAEGADFFSGQDVYQAEAPDALHKKVNTTSYNYTDYKAFEQEKHSKRAGAKKNASRRPRADAQGQAAPANEHHSVGMAGGVLTEEFNMINFAPREPGPKLITSKLFAKEHTPAPGKNKKGARAKAPGQGAADAGACSFSPGGPGPAMENKKASGKKRSGKKQSPAATRPPTGTTPGGPGGSTPESAGGAGPTKTTGERESRRPRPRRTAKPKSAPGNTGDGAGSMNPGDGAGSMNPRDGAGSEKPVARDEAPVEP